MRSIAAAWLMLLVMLLVTRTCFESWGRRQTMHSAMKRACLGTVVVALAGCGGTKTLMPPRIDLQTFRKVGLVQFSSNDKEQLQTLASQDFIESIQASQPGIPVLELGQEDQVLAAIGHDQVDREAIQAIGKQFDVDAVIVGNLEVTDVKPKIGIQSVFSGVDVQADVEAALTTRLMEVGSGATVWTRSARSKETVASAGVTKQGNVHFGASDPEATYGSLIQTLVREITQDFRPYWVKQ
jgi:hypothetical protein